MRDILTIAASLVILVLTAALVGPWFVDWTAHRGWVESELSRVSSWRVQAAGDIDLKLLPVPRIELQQVHVASSRGEGPSLDMASVKLELAAASLLRGELRFTDAEVERPQLTLLRHEDGSIVLPQTPNFAAAGVQIEKLTLRHGSVAVRSVSGGTPIVIGGLDFTGEAGSLIGPFKGAGVIRVGAEPVKYRFTTSAIEGDRIRVKAIVDESALAPRADLDGALGFVRDGSGVRPVFEGTGAFSATDVIAGAPVPWRLSGPLKADAAKASLEPADLRAGDEERAVAASGAVTLDFAPRLRINAAFAARQLDFDRLFAKGQDGAPAGRRLAGLAAQALADSSLSDRLPFPLSLVVTSPAATLAGETLTDLRGEVGLASGEAPRVKLSLFGPARSALAIDGAVETGAAAAFRGKLDLSLRDLPRFSDWLEQSLPGEAKRLRDLPFRAIDIAGDMEMSSGGALGRNLSLRIDRSELAGTMAYTRAAGREPARLFADLTSDALDLDGLPEIAGPARLAADVDLSLALEARAVRLERFGAGFVDAGRIGLKLLKDGGGVRLERFAIDNIGGASVSASAHMNGDDMQVDARLDAARLADLASLVQRVAPGPFADALAARATALSPARLTLSARGAGVKGLEDIRIEGALRGSRVEANGKGALDALDVTASAENADAVMLLRQLGLDTLPLAGLGPGRVDLRGKGSPATGFETSIVAKAARSEAGFDGRVGLRDGRWTGAVRLRSPDAGPILRALAIVLPDANASLPLDATAQVERADKALTLSNLSGLVAGAFVNGALHGQGEGDARRWTGELKVDRLGLPTLASLALGPMAGAGPAWPDQKLAPGLADPPRIDLRVTAGEFELSDASVARDASFDLRLAPGLVAIEGARMKFGAGALDGQIAFRRDGASASIAGRAELSNVALPSGPVSGAASGQVDFTSTGQSYATLAGGLAGSGKIEIARLSIAGADPSGITRLIKAADAGGLEINEKDMRARLARELDAQALTMERAPFDLSMAAGVLRLSSRREAGGAPAIDFAYDMRQLSGAARVGLVAPQAPKDWTGPPPAATVIWQGRAGALQRSVEAGPLFNAISARAIAREAARVEALEADIRERAYFNRRAKAFEFMRRREGEVAAYLEEQRRAQAEEAKRKAEEERRKADDDRRKAEEEKRRLEAEKQRETARLPADAATGRASDEAAAAAQRRRAFESLKQRAEDSLRAIQQRPTPPSPQQRPAPPPATPDPLASGPY